MTGTRATAVALLLGTFLGAGAMHAASRSSSPPPGALARMVADFFAARSDEESVRAELLDEAGSPSTAQAARARACAYDALAAQARHSADVDTATDPPDDPLPADVAAREPRLRAARHRAIADAKQLQRLLGERVRALEDENEDYSLGGTTPR